MIGNLVYTQEIVRPEGTFLDFWYEIKNGEGFLAVDLSLCSHGFEQSEVGFYDENSELDGIVRPEHIWELVEEWKKDGGRFIQNI